MFSTKTTLIMKTILTLTAFISALTFMSCKKDNENPKPQIANIEFTLFDVRTAGDSNILEVNYPSTLILKSDFTWTIDLGGTKSNGTYTWTPISKQQADIKFTITQWTDFSSNSILSDKLKSALKEVNHCGYSLQTPSFANFLDNNFQADYFPSIRTNKK
jgi:hypothetical protein